MATRLSGIRFFLSQGVFKVNFCEVCFSVKFLSQASVKMLFGVQVLWHYLFIYTNEMPDGYFFVPIYSLQDYLFRWLWYYDVCECLKKMPVLTATTLTLRSSIFIYLRSGKFQNILLIYYCYSLSFSSSFCYILAYRYIAVHTERPMVGTFESLMPWNFFNNIFNILNRVDCDIILIVFGH